MHPHLIRRPPSGFPFGYTAITQVDETENGTGMEFGILRLRSRQWVETAPDMESATLLLFGDAVFAWDGAEHEAERDSVFDDPPVAVHHGPGSSVRIFAYSDCEFAVVSAANDRTFGPVLFDAATLAEIEQRDRDRWDGAAWREVRTLFDRRNRPEAALVLGEVVHKPGRWSSYPPHHHPQPEIYHYRFSHKAGYGHAELGEDVLKVRSCDTVKILEGRDHAQVAAPGYGMYYIWAIRHLPGNPYTGPEFAPEHAWLLTPDGSGTGMRAGTEGQEG